MYQDSGSPIRSDDESAKELVRRTTLQSLVTALGILADRVSDSPSERLGVFSAIEVLAREIGQVAASARSGLEAIPLEVPPRVASPPKHGVSALAEPATLADPGRAGDDTSATSDADEESVASNVREILETLPDISQLGENTAKRLFNALPHAKITKTPRAGSRGNALLYVLSRYGRNRSLGIKDLEFAFETMNVPLGNAPSYHRIVSWEIRELIRRGWPITEDEGGFRFNGTAVAPAEGKMT